MKHSLSVGLSVMVASAALSLTACEIDRAVVADVAVHATSAVLEPPAADLDEEWAILARGPIPGFAGIHTGAAGELVAAVSRSESSTLALEFARMIAERRGSRPSARVELVAYGFEYLKPWKDSVAQLLNRSDVVWVDIDEVRNRVVVGVEGLVADSRVREAALRYGIPTPAIQVVPTERPKPRSTYLTDRVRPVVGGFEIQYWVSLYVADGCTIGFNAYRNGVRGFVTNSHCSTSEFSTDYTVQHQAQVGLNGIDRIGAETYDPGGTRYADAAFYAYDSGSASNFAHVARTTFSSVNADGSREIDSIHPLFRIVSLTANNLQTVGEPVMKVGRTTGWTAGQISQTCVTLDGKPCQWVAVLWSWEGDSGSPIFQQIGTSEPDASRISLFGILWGGPADSSVTWYSPIAGVQQDLGTLDIACDSLASVCKPSPPIVSILGPSQVQESQVCAWYSTVTGGALPYSYEWKRDNVQVSTATSYGTTDTGQSSFLLELTVTDALQSVGFAYLNVTVQGSGQFDCGN